MREGEARGARSLREVTERRARGRRLAATAFLGLAAVAAAAFGAEKKKLSISDLTADPPLAGRPAASLAWLPDSKSFTYLVRKVSGAETTSELWMQNAASGDARKLLDEAGFAPAAPSPASAAAADAREKPEKQEKHEPRATISEYEWSRDGRMALVSAGDRLWLYDRAASRVERLTQGEGGEEYGTFSPDGKRVAFVRKNDLYAVDLATRRETRLTSDGGDLVVNGKCDWVYEEELANRSGRAYEWSPDGTAIAYLRLDDTPIDPYPLTDFLPVPARITWQRYPKAGAKNPLVSFRVVGMQGRTLASVPLEGEGYIAPSFSWTRDSGSVSYRVLNREQNREEVRVLDRNGWASRVLLTEEDPYWINDDGADPPRFLADGRFVWKSERSGFAHLYVGDLRGAPLAAITRGNWMVDRVLGIDEKKGLVYFTATEENVRRREIYRVGLDGKGFAKLTNGKGTHAAELSPDGAWLLDTFSTVADPPVLSLLDTAGKAVRVLRRPETRLAEFELAATQEVAVVADDGARLEARLVKPAGFDSSRKYPVVVMVYGGPHAQVVHDAWGATSLLDHYLASRGFLVWSLDNRGSWGRGHAWESVIFKNMGKRELADQLAGVRYLKALPYVDPERIGIWGWSYGGYMTLYALTNAPDVWKCGVAGAPVTHWKFYDSIYTERYMRTPRDNAAGYESSAPLTKAGDLKAKLLLIHGTSDDNVHMQNTVAFIDALVKAEKRYDLRIGPGQKHGFRGKAATDFANESIAKFFEENL